MSRFSLGRYRNALAFIFVCLSIDEAASFHEILAEPLRNMLGTSGILYFAWVIPGAAFALAVAIVFIPFLCSLPLATALRFVASGAIYVGGALGMELVGGYLADNGLLGSPLYMIVSTIEESMEMVGMALFFSAALDHLVQTQPNWRLGNSG
ncbi:hypothetical protein CSC94_23865 [Zhengella mangrovi]|uniref:Uncharacterized protein n=1 Tax=Zhengella mangrovi TaxID=1982044 RepID=A0A2G1QG89_9HYPH|nr:hypothetical protein CSC94_23865 [Zhengella mangrovi]